MVARLYCTRRSDGRAALVGEYVNGIDRDGNEGIHGHCEFSSGICHDARVTFRAFFDVETRCVQKHSPFPCWNRSFPKIRHPRRLGDPYMKFSATRALLDALCVERRSSERPVAPGRAR